MSEILQAASVAPAEDNPLLKAWQTPHQTPPCCRKSCRNISFRRSSRPLSITPPRSPPSAMIPRRRTFPTPSRRWSARGKLLNKVSAVFYDLVSAHSNPAILEIDKEVSLRMARHWNPIMMNAVLFGRIALLHDNRASLELTPEQTRLLERTYTRFHRAGAGLSEEAKKRMAEINERLAHLGTTFSHHLLGDEQQWFMELSEDDHAGLPDTFIAAAKAAAEERGHGRQGDRDAVALERRTVAQER